MSDKPAKPGRPKTTTEDIRSASLPSLRVTESERQTIEARAADAGLSVSAYCRAAIFEQRVQRRAQVAPIHATAVVELNRAGVNLNQLVRHANRTGYLAHDLNEVLAEVRTAVAKLAAMVNE